MRRLVPVLVIAAFLLPALWATGDEPVPPAGMATEEEEALDLLATVMTSDDGEERRKAVRRLSIYRYPSVAFALVDMLEDHMADPRLLQEVEWALVSMSSLALEPLADAVREGRVPSGAALLVLTRIARQEPNMVTPLLKDEHPELARVAAVAVASCGHPGKLDALLATFDDAALAARQATLQAVCNLSRSRCFELVEKSLKGDDEQLKVTALGLLKTLKEPRLVSACVPLLHSDNQLLVAAVMEALTALGARGAEKDLAILFDAASPDLKEQVLHVLAQTYTQEAFAFLKKVAENQSSRTRLGRLAHRLHRDSAGKLVLLGEDRETAPAEAELKGGPAGFTMVLYNKDGFRVVVSGILEVKCRQRVKVRRKIAPEHFDPEGNLDLKYRCPRNKHPGAAWVLPDGKKIQARRVGAGN